MSTAPAPWPAPQSVIRYISAAGLPALPSELLNYHVHAHLDVFVNGVSQPVAAGIGIDFLAGQISPLHTHDTTGIIHIESGAPTTFTFGQFLTEWGLRHDNGCVAAYCPPATPVRTFVNGTPTDGNGEQVALERYEEIAVVIGTPPASVPDHYDFPEGY